MGRIILIGVLVFVCSGVLGCSERLSQDRVCYQDACFDVEVALKEEARQKGLMFRDSLGEKEGMLFVFSESGKHSFWMKNTHLTLDMIWIDYNRKIVHIVHNAQPCVEEPCEIYTPSEEAMYVLEINAGQARANGLREGVQLDFDLVNF